MAPNPTLHLVNLPADRVDWDRTNRYAATARMTRYVKTQAEDDYGIDRLDLVYSVRGAA